METTEFKVLLEKYNKGACTVEEKALIEDWYLQLNDSSIENLSNEQIQSIILMDAPIGLKKSKWSIIRWGSIAAAIFIVAIAGVLFFSKLDDNNKSMITSGDISAPKTDRAFLTLSNGQKIALDHSNIGDLAHQENAYITKTGNNQLIYNSKLANHQDKKISYNTLSTPKGGQYAIVLSDGTKVWLNAASSITYPTTFSGQERIVSLSGEAYFEVSHIQDKPFKVISKNQMIEVLGTHFNVDAYLENTVKTTLLQGEVRVSSGGKMVLLKPGEQASATNGALAKTEVDTEQAIAWHYGDFIFSGQHIKEIMNTLSRWYDVEIVYEGQIDNQKTFSGAISRSKNLSAVIKMLKTGTSMKFDIHGQKVIVSE